MTELFNTAPCAMGEPELVPSISKNIPLVCPQLWKIEPSGFVGLHATLRPRVKTRGGHGCICNLCPSGIYNLPLNCARGLTLT